PFQWLALLIVHLLIHVKHVRLIARGQYLNATAAHPRPYVGAYGFIVFDHGKVGDPRMLLRRVEAHFPRQRLTAYRRGIDLELEAPAFDVAHIGGRRLVEIRTGRHRHVGQQVVRLTRVVLHRTGDAVAPQPEVDTVVEGAGGLPAQVVHVNRRPEHVIKVLAEPVLGKVVAPVV